MYDVFLEHYLLDHNIEIISVKMFQPILIPSPQNIEYPLPKKQRFGDSTMKKALRVYAKRSGSSGDR